MATAGADYFAGRAVEVVTEIADNATRTLDFPFEAAGSGGVYLAVSTPSGVQRFAKRIDPDGTFVITGVPEGEARLVAHAGFDYSNQAAGEAIKFFVGSEPVVRLAIDIVGGRTVHCNVTGLYEDENRIGLTVFEGVFEPGDRSVPFGNSIVVASIRTEPGASLELRGLRPGVYTIKAHATALSPSNAVRSSRDRILTIRIPKESDVRPIQIDIAF